MTKELEAFKGLLKQMFPNYDIELSLDFICNANENLNIIRTALKEKEKQDEILRIIKEYPEELKWIDISRNFEDYELRTGYYRKFNQTKFELLKEWLKDEN